MDKCLYNGIEFIDLNPYWEDKETYPYACILRLNEALSSTKVVFSSLPMREYVDWTTTNSNGAPMRGWGGSYDGTSYYEVTVGQYPNYEIKSISAVKYRETAGIISGATTLIDRWIYWANYDVVGENGTIVVVASDPVPVIDDGKTFTDRLYNGVQLPDINEVWTEGLKGKYPYAVIYRSYGIYILQISINPGYITLYRDEYTYAVNKGSISFAIDIEGTSDYYEEYWKHYGTDTTNVNFAYALPFWSSYDVYYDEGSLYLAASDPVPVPDEPAPVLSWQKHDAYKPNSKWDGNTFYRVMGGKWVKQGGVVPTE